MKNVDVREATPADIRRWYNGPPPVTMRAQVMEQEGDLIGIWGVQSTNGMLIAFSVLTPAARKLKKEIVKGVRMMRKLLRQYPEVIAFATRDEPTSEAFIRHIGFTHVGSSSNGEVYLWARQ